MPRELIFVTRPAARLTGATRIEPIKASFDRGKVELDGGRHRAGSVIERGVDPVAPEQRQLDALRARCEAQRLQARESGRERNRDGESGGDRVRS
jgi:hypothetical protein